MFRMTHERTQRRTRCAAALCVLSASALCRAAGWQDPAVRETLSNDALVARLQGGFLYELKTADASRALIDMAPGELTAVLPAFGPPGVDLGDADVVMSNGTAQVDYTLTWADGTAWSLSWTVEATDLVLRASAQLPAPTGMFAYTLEGCHIAEHTVVTVGGYGVAHARSAPFTGTIFGGTTRDAMPWTLLQPLVALFEGDGGGWFVEGRDLQIGPSNLRPFGMGDTVDLVISRAFPEVWETNAPALFEVRLRPYAGDWEDAVDPYLKWMEDDAGFVPLDANPLGWVQNVRNQAYVTVKDYAGLYALAGRVDPARTYLGRQAGYRYWGFDKGYPDYRVPPSVAPWIAAVRSLGFHFGVHVNIGGIDRSNTNLIAQMEPGLMQVGTDGEANPVWDGTASFVYCSAAHPPWRAHLIGAVAEVVAAGADVIYLDQSMAPIGKYVIDGVTGTQGVMLLMQELLAAYPGVAIQTEQFNTMTARHACLALSQMTLGHPLSGYIFSRFIKIVPEGIMYSPVDLATLDAFASYGFMAPGTDTTRSESWLQIVDAFQAYNLVPDSRLPLAPPQMSGFAGAGGVTAYLEKTATTRSLVIYEDGQPPMTNGLRHTAITEWPGPGYIDDWLIYSDGTMEGLDPAETYWFDDSVTLDPARFHVTGIPADYLPYRNDTRKIIPQEVGPSDANFRLFFSGTGLMTMHVPDAYDVYLDGARVPVDRGTQTAAAMVAATPADPSELLVFARSEQRMEGYWAELSFMRPQHKIYFVSLADSIYPPYGVYCHVGGVGFIIGRFPAALDIRVKGRYGMRDDAFHSRGDGVIKVNGVEVLRLDPGTGPPYEMIPFDVDLSAYAGHYALVEFASDGDIHGNDPADWDAPQFVVSDSLDAIGDPSAANGWNTSAAVSVRASSAHYARPWVQTIDGSGLDPASGLRHTPLDVNDTMGLSSVAGTDVSRGGTVFGSHWVEYAFDRVYRLGQMWIWNYNEVNWPVFAMKQVTIQCSWTGGAQASDWATIFDGALPPASGAGLTDSAVDRKVDFGGAMARYVVVTTDAGLDQNYSAGQFAEVGLSEVRFFSQAPGSFLIVH